MYLILILSYLSLTFGLNPSIQTLKNSSLFNLLVSKVTIGDDVRELPDIKELAKALPLLEKNLNFLNISDVESFVESSSNRISVTVPSNFKHPLVSTSHGIIRGLQIEEDGLRYYSFLGVPYAEKPERFKQPQPLKPWKGIKDARKEEKSCIQIEQFLQKIGGSEDCLYLNINTPSLDDYANLPVIVWIHGGSFKHGTASQVVYGPQRFIQEEIVVVNIAYRLGAFGFLSTGTQHAPGNAGLKDIVMALKWLQNNIHMFGGDNFNICLYGISTGAAMIEYLTMSPMGQSLFQKTIIHSGSTLSSNFYSKDTLKTAFKLGSYLGNNSTDINILMNVLKTADSIDIVKATEEMDSKEGLMKNFLFAPTVEKVISGEDTFLCDTPENNLKNGKYIQVPSLIGFNKDEGLISFSFLNSDISEILESSNDILEYLLSDIFLCVKDHQLKKRILDDIKWFYFRGRKIGISTIQNFVDMIGDYMFTFGIQKSVYYKSKRLKVPIYYYKFVYDGSLGLSKRYVPEQIISGVAHADDIPYTFKFLFTESIYENDEVARSVSKTLLTLYANFMRYGNPTPYASGNLPIWEPVNNDTLPYLEISETAILKNNPNEERFKFWTNVHELINKT